MNLRRQDTARTVATVKAYLNGQDLQAQNIDSVNSGNDCLYHSIRRSLCHTQGNIVDKFSQEIDGVAQPAVLLKDMTTQ